MFNATTHSTHAHSLAAAGFRDLSIEEAKQTTGKSDEFYGLHDCMINFQDFKLAMEAVVIAVGDYLLSPWQDVPAFDLIDEGINSLIDEGIGSYYQY